MKIIDEYRMLIEEIAVCESKISRVKREIQKRSDRYKPESVKAIDYNDERVQTSKHLHSMIETYDVIVGLNIKVGMLQNELEILYSQRCNIEEVIEDLGDIRKKVLMLRVKRKSISEIVDSTGYSERQIFRIIKHANDQYSKIV